MLAVIPHVRLNWTDEENVMQERVAAKMIASARQAMPGIKIVQITDQRSAALGVDEVVRKPFSYPLIPWLADHLADLDSSLLFLDTDIIVQKDLRLMQELEADLVIPVRRKSIKADDGTVMYVLFGVVYASGPKVWQELSRRTRNMEREADRNWWGFQLQSWELLKESYENRGPFLTKAVRQWQFNYVPKHSEDKPEDVWVIHYKGTRKPWMLGEQSN